LRDVLVAMATRAPDLMLSFGGHAMAAGLSLEYRNLPKFRALFAQEMAKHESQLPEQAVIWSDGALSANELTLDFTQTLHTCTPWGTDCPEPLFDNAFEVIERTPLKDGLHWRLMLRPLTATKDDPARLTGRIEPIPAIWFGIGDQLPLGRFWHLAYRLSLNYFRGQTTLQLMVASGTALSAVVAN
jgi:single-stranded-DNA-specific exonuclease